ncbi:MAG TPA: hypothetical protein VF535_16715 [Allosphingosinicella sp.]|jgi:hypothetical protein
MSDGAPALRALAHQCRQLALGASLPDVAAALDHMARDYDRQAERADEAQARTRDMLAGPGAAAGPRPAAGGAR